MKNRQFSAPSSIAFAIAALLTVPVRAQEEAPAPAARLLPDRPDPREIPVPPVAPGLPSLPGVDALPVRKEMPDALTMNDGTKVTTPEQFRARQKEMREILEYYHVGRMPPAPGNVKGKVTQSEVVTIPAVDLPGASVGLKVRYRLVHLTFGPDEKLFLDVGILTPEGAGPVPSVIQPGGEPPGGPHLPTLAKGPMEGRGMDILLPPDIALANPGTNPPRPRLPGGPGALPGAARGGRPGGPGGPPGGGFGFGGPVTPQSLALRVAQVLNHGFGYITFNTNDCAEDTTLRMPDGSFAFRTTRFYPAYPGYDWGIIGGWVWGTMRVVDYLQDDALVDKSKIIITGTSRIGKAAMISGSFDDRIAMVAPGASSGGGTPAYRHSGGATTQQPSRGGKEGLTLMVMKYGNQFGPNLHQFWGQADKLPYDAHWFAALTAPRPFIMLEGTKDQNVVHNGIRQTWLAAQPAFALMGVPDKLGVWWSDRPHGFGDTDWDGLLSFADKNLLGKRVSRAFDLFPADTDATANN
jgi:hypothetical protein